jgi:membrane protein implicated in regulation of membrane protease activity
MWILAIGWMYVVTLMAATEPSVVGGIMTFLGLGVLPLSLVLYLGGVRFRRRVQQAPRQDATAPDAGPEN